MRRRRRRVVTARLVPCCLARAVGLRYGASVRFDSCSKGGDGARGGMISFRAKAYGKYGWREDFDSASWKFLSCCASIEMLAYSWGGCARCRNPCTHTTHTTGHAISYPTAHIPKSSHGSPDRIRCHASHRSGWLPIDASHPELAPNSAGVKRTLDSTGRGSSHIYFLHTIMQHPPPLMETFQNAEHTHTTHTTRTQYPTHPSHLPSAQGGWGGRV